jgi:hypothetical protein
MIKFILPAIIIFLIIIFWEKINNKIYQKIKIKINHVFGVILVLTLLIIFTLLYL